MILQKSDPLTFVAFHSATVFGLSHSAPASYAPSSTFWLSSPPPISGSCSPPVFCVASAPTVVAAASSAFGYWSLESAGASFGVSGTGCSSGFDEVEVSPPTVTAFVESWDGATGVAGSG